MEQKVYHFQWINDFGKARNFSLSKATGDWILVLDADEILDGDAQWKIKEIIDKLEDKYPLSPKIINYDDSGKYMTEHFHCRLFPAKDYLYEGVIHEQLRFKDGRPPIVTRVPEVIIHHYGYGAGYYKEKGKGERNIGLLRKQLEKDKKNPFHYYNLQSSYYVEEDYEKSLQCFRSVKKYAKRKKGKIPFLPASYVIASNSYISLKKYQKALKLAKQALEYSPDFSDALYLISVCHHKTKNYLKAIDFCRKAINTKSSGRHLLRDKSTAGWKSYRLLGMIYFDMERWEDSIKSHEKVLEEVPDDAFSTSSIARCYDRLNNIEKAFQYYRKAANLGGSGYKYFLLDMAYFMERYKGKDEAIALIDKYLEVIPHSSLVILAKGEIYRRKNEWHKALHIYNLVLSSKEKITEGYKSLIHLNRGICYYHINDLDKAEEDFKTVIKNKPDESYSYVNLGYIYLDKKNYIKACSVLKKAREIDRENMSILLALSEAFLYSGEEDKAFRLLDKISSSKKDEYIKAQFVKADYYQSLKELTAAHSLIMNLISIYPNEISIYSYLVKILLAQGNFSTALNMYDCLLTIKPDDVSILHKKGKVLEFLKRYEEARDLYLKALAVEPHNEKLKNALENLPLSSNTLLAAG